MYLEFFESLKGNLFVILSAAASSFLSYFNSITTCSSSRIFLESIYNETKKIFKLRGLMDNRQILVPFLNLKMIGKPSRLDFYQYHQLAMYFHSDDSSDYVHGQITTCKAAMIHPIIKSIPCDFKMAIFVAKLSQIFYN